LGAPGKGIGWETRKRNWKGKEEEIGEGGEEKESGEGEGKFLFQAMSSTACVHLCLAVDLERRLCGMTAE